MEKANREFLAALGDNEQQEFRRLLRAVRNPDAVLPAAE
jgi:hypothetical protein